ncbi:MAG: hypothetical protein ACTS6G_05295 [Candidatus Hodgkinia cicadicola]
MGTLTLRRTELANEGSLSCRVCAGGYFSLRTTPHVTLYTRREARQSFRRILTFAERKSLRGERNEKMKDTPAALSAESNVSKCSARLRASCLAIQASKPVTRTPWYKCATRRTQRTASSPPSYTSKPHESGRNSGKIKFAPSSEVNINCIHEPAFAGLVKLFITSEVNMCELIISVGRMFALPQWGTKRNAFRVRRKWTRRSSDEFRGKLKFESLLSEGNEIEEIDLTRSRPESSLVER